MAFFSDLVKKGNLNQTAANAATQTAKTPQVNQTISIPSMATGQTVQMPTARQTLLAQPEQNKWYKGETPTSGEVMAQIYRIGQTDSNLSGQLWNAFQEFQKDPSSIFYNPYNQPTNKAVQELKNLGFDIGNGVTSKWLEDNSWLKNYYRMENGTTPLAPSKKSSREENAAYWYYQLLKSEETTQKAENEWAALQEEIKFLANRKDRNYTDDEILSMIDWDHYKTLAGMDEDRKNGLPTSLNRGMDYSRDNLLGVIWAARNGSTGNALFDTAKAFLGAGKGWVENKEMRDKLNPESENYSPFSVGSTLDDAALYFGVENFDEDWINSHRYILSGNDATAKKYYDQVVEAEKNTQQAEKELKELWNQVNEWLKYPVDADTILDGLFDDYKTLQKMDESLGKSKLFSTTRAVNYRRQDVEAEIKRRIEEKKGKNTAEQTASDLGVSTTTTEANDSIKDIQNDAITSAAPVIVKSGTEEDKTVFSTAGDSGFDKSVSDISSGITSGTMTPEESSAKIQDYADQEATEDFADAAEKIVTYEYFKAGNGSLDNYEEDRNFLMGLSSRQNQERAELYNIIKTYAPTVAGNYTWSLLNKLWDNGDLDQASDMAALMDAVKKAINAYEKSQEIHFPEEPVTEEQTEEGTEKPEEDENRDYLLGLSSRQNQQKAQLYNAITAYSPETGSDYTWNLLNRMWENDDLDVAQTNALAASVKLALEKQREKDFGLGEKRVEADNAQKTLDSIGKDYGISSRIPQYVADANHAPGEWKGKNSFYTYTGNLMKPFNEDWMNDQYFNTVVELNKSNSGRSNVQVMHDAFEIVNTQAIYMERSASLRDYDPQYSAVYQKVGETIYQEELGRMMANYAADACENPNDIRRLLWQTGYTSEYDMMVEEMGYYEDWKEENGLDDRMDSWAEWMLDSRKGIEAAKVYAEMSRDPSVIQKEGVGEIGDLIWNDMARGGYSDSLQEAYYIMKDESGNYTQQQKNDAKKEIQQYARDMATNLLEMAKFFPEREVSGQNLDSYQQGLLDRYHDTVEGAKVWAEEAQGTDEQEKAERNQWFVQNREQYSEIEQSDDYKAWLATNKDNTDEIFWTMAQTYAAHFASPETLVFGIDPLGEVNNILMMNLTTPEERTMLAYIKDANGIGAAEDYYAYLEFELGKRLEERYKAGTEVVADKTGGKALLSGISLIQRLGSAAGFIDNAYKLAEKKITGDDKPLNYSSGSALVGKQANMDRNAVMERVNWQANILGKDVDLFDFIYGSGMSMADSQLASVIPIAGPIILGASAANDTMQEINERGGSETQALLGGLVSGIFEYAFEKVSLSKFWDEAKALKDPTLKKTLWNVLAQAGINFSEEFNTSVANILYDTIVNGEYSEFKAQVDEIRKLAPDMSESEAAAKVMWGQFEQALQEGYGGAFMGFFMGFESSAISAMRTKKADRYTGSAILRGQNQYALKNIGLSMDSKSYAYKLASKFEPGKSTAREAGRLFRTIYQNVSESTQETMTSNLNNDIREKMVQLGSEGEFDAVEGIAAMYMGEEMTPDQARAVAESPAALDIVAELMGAEEVNSTSNMQAYDNSQINYETSGITDQELQQEEANYKQAQAEANGDFGPDAVQHGVDMMKSIEDARAAREASSLNNQTNTIEKNSTEANGPMPDMAEQINNESDQSPEELQNIALNNQINNGDFGPDAQKEAQEGETSRTVYALTKAKDADTTTQTATIAAALKGNDTTNMPTAAAQHLTKKFGPAAIDVVRDIILEAKDKNAVKKAVCIAAMGDGAATQVLESVAQNGVTPDGIDSLIEAANQDVQDEGVQQQLAKTLTDNLISTEVKNLIANGGAAGLQPYMTALAQAKTNEQNAIADLEQAYEQKEAMEENLQRVTEEYLNDINPATQGAVQQAANELKGQAKVISEYEQSVANAKDARKVAEDNLQAQQDATMKELRDQATEAVAAQQQQAAEQGVQEAYNSAIALLKPTTEFGQIVQAELQDGTQVGITGVAFIDKNENAHFTTDNGQVISETALNPSELEDGSALLAAWSPFNDFQHIQAEQQAGQPTVPFEVSFEAMRKDTGEMVQLIGYAPQNGHLEANVMLADGTVLPMHMVDVSALSSDEKMQLVDVYNDHLNELTGEITEENVETTQAEQEETTEPAVENAEAPAETTQAPVNSTEHLTKQQKQNVLDSQNMNLESWQDPKNHGKVKKPRKASTKTKAFQKWFSDPTGELSNDDGSPKIFYRGFGSFGSKLYINHQSKQDSEGNYYNFYMDKISTAKSYAGTSKIISLYDMVNWETAKKAMSDIGLSLVDSPNPSNPAEMGYMLYDHNGHQMEWYAEDDLSKFNESYGGTPKTKGIFAGYISAKNPLVIDAQNSGYYGVKATVKDANGNDYTAKQKTRLWAQWAFKNGYDALIVKNVTDNAHDSGEIGTEVVTKSSSQFKSIYNNGKWSSNPDIRYYKPGTLSLTGEPLSIEFLNAQHRLANGEHMTTEELMKIPEIQQAEQNMMQGNSVDVLSPEELASRVSEWTDNLMDMGSFSGYETGLDGTKKPVYNGEVRQEKILDVVMGPPSAGKSSVLVEPLSQKRGSRVFDPDTVKEMTPEYQGGLNSGYVHMESRMAMKEARGQAIANGDNVVLPIVGWNYDSVKRDVQPFIDAGYTIYLHHVDLDINKAMGRALGRYATDGRYIGVDYLNDTVQNRPREVYDRLKGEDWVAGYEQLDNGVPKNERPILKETSGLGGLDGLVRPGDTGGHGENSQNGTGGKAQEVRDNGKTRDETNGISYYKNGSQDEAAVSDWNNTEVMSGQDIIEDLVEKLGMVNEPRMKKYIRRLRKTTGGYTMNNGVIHVKNAQDTRVAVHEIGHNIDKAIGMQGMVKDMNALRQKYDSMYGPAFLGQYKDHQVPGELMAEFTRIWVTDRNAAVELAGEDFVNQFENALKKKGWLKPMQEAAQRIYALANADAIQIARSMVELDVKKQKNDPSISGLKGIGAKYFDKTLPFQEVTRILRKSQGAGFDYSGDTRTLMLAQNNLAYNMANACIESGLVDPQGNKVLDKNGKQYRGLNEIMKAIDMKDEGDFNAYLLAFLSIERKAAGKPTFNFKKSPTKLIQDLEAEHPEFKQTRAELLNWYNAMMKTWLVDTNILQPNEFAAMRALYPSYVPAIPVDVRGQSGNNKAGNAPTNGVRRAGEHGNEKNSNIYNPVMAMQENLYRYTALAKQVETMRAFVHQMRDIMHNGGDLSAFAEPAQKDMQYVSYEDANKEAQQAVMTKVTELQKQGEITDEAVNQLIDVLEDLEDGAFKSRNYSTDGDVINVRMEDGSVSSWTIYNKAMLEAFTNMPDAQRNKAIRAVSKLTRFLSSMATSRSIPFTFQNFASDTETAANTGRGAFWNGLLPVYVGQQLYSAANLLKNKVADTKLGEKLGLTPSEQYRLFSLFGEMGSKYSIREQAKQKEMRKAMYSGSTTVGDVVKTILRSPITAVETVADFLEDTTRFTAFRTSGDTLGTYEGRLRAGQNAREASVDFSKSGYADLGLVKAVKPFLGAQLQGLYKTARLFSSENEGNRAKIVGRMLINSILLNGALAAVRGLTWKPEEKEAYDRLTPYERSKYYHIKNPDGTFTRVKRSQDALIQISDALGYFIGNTITGHEGDDWGDLMKMAVAIGENAAVNADSTLDPFFDAANNKTWYNGAIDDYNDLQQSVTARYNPNTFAPYRIMSNLLNAVGIEYSPKQVEYVANQYLGSFGTIGSGLVDLSSEGKLDPQNFLYMMNDYLGSKFSVDPVYTNGLSKAFYASKENMSKAIKEAENGKSPELFNYNLTDEQRADAYTEAKKLTQTGGKIYKISKQISDLWKKHDNIQKNDNLTRDEQKEQAREVRKQINALYMEGNTIMGDYWNKYGYNNALEQNAMNTLDMFTGKKNGVDADAQKRGIVYETVPETFRNDDGQVYMQRSLEVFDDTGKETALPRPQYTFEVTNKNVKTSYEVKDAYKEEYTAVYKMNYQQYIVKNGIGWDTMTEDQKLDVLQGAHRKANDAAKKWYMRITTPGVN